MSLTNKAVSAVLWSGLEILFRQGLRFVISIVLARLLSPEEFGTIALLYLFIGIASVFIEGGLSWALIQRQDVTHTDESTVFWFNLSMGVLFAALLVLAAPWISDFYGQPVLIPLTATLALCLFINSLGSIHFTLLSKKLDFKTPMKIGVAATIASGSTAIFLAMKGYGVWALAVQMLVSSLVTTGLLWKLCDWRPRVEFSLASARRLFGFSSYLMLSALLDVGYNRLYTLLIGKFYGVRELGFYSRAESTKQVPEEILSGVLSRAAFPIFSAAASDKGRLQRGMRLALRGIMVINIPMMLGLMVTAKSVVVVLFGETWAPAVPIMQVLCLGAVFWPLHVINLNVLNAQGHSNLFFRLEIVKKALGIGLLLVGLLYGPIGIAWSQAVFGFVAFFINAHYTKRHLEYGSYQQMRDIVPVLLTSAVMAISTHLVGISLDQTPLITLAVQVAFGVIVFALICSVLRIGAFIDLLALLAQHRK